MMSVLMMRTSLKVAFARSVFFTLSLDMQRLMLLFLSDASAACCGAVSGSICSFAINQKNVGQEV